ncbi:hypothetical protein KSP35_20885 [Aquihabitans sp. G128]|uniref:hypothetical protein n=1 Tax=Aquihabitans sp. G128 TaxID=2849779 RepID=UPI001C235EF5|nr:hypothetical protein [Aquihabitans sp. G128]QXC60748.1 hypothetical protein KSP35_20885 [Aquihabitans sp. G128]
MEHPTHPDIDQRFANRFLALVVAASVLCFVALAVLAAAHPASASTRSSADTEGAAPVAHHTAATASTGAWRTGIDGLDLALIALTLLGVAILVRRHAPVRR